jgi:hypothetical protein
MPDRYHNPFQTFDILVPVEFHESLFERYCQTGGSKRIEASPFPRMIDLWFFALCIAVKEQKDPINYSSLQTTKIIDGSIFSSDPWRIHALMLIATSLTDSIDIVADPRKVMTLASELAVAGLPIVQDMLNSGQQAPLWNLSDSVAKMTG